LSSTAFGLVTLAAAQPIGLGVVGQQHLGYTTRKVFAVSIASWAAEDGAVLYKSKCAGCHGANGDGKPAMKDPALKGTKLEASQIVEHRSKGEPQSKAHHNKGMSGLGRNFF
jgi:mono/diheme cytochrome c family protein